MFAEVYFQVMPEYLADSNNMDKAFEFAGRPPFCFFEPAYTASMR